MEPMNGSSGANGAADPLSVDPDTAESLARSLTAALAAPKLQSQHLQNHHGAEQLYVARCRLAKESKLSEEQIKNIVPYPAPSSSTIIYNDTTPLIAMLGQLIGAAQSAATPAQPVDAPKQPTDKPVKEKPAGTTPAKSPWKNWLWPLVAAAGLGGSGLAAYFLWPDREPVDPPTVEQPVEPAEASDVEGDFGVQFR